MDLGEESNEYVSGFLFWTLWDAHILNLQPLFVLMQTPGILVRVDEKVIKNVRREETKPEKEDEWCWAHFYVQEDEFSRGMMISRWRNLTSESSYRRTETDSHATSWCWWYIVLTAFQDTTYPKPLAHVHKGHDYWNGSWAVMCGERGLAERNLSNDFYN